MADETVHVIDDDEAVRASLAFLLEMAAFAPRTYASAAEFLAAQPAELDGCVVTDIRMPEMNGLELIRRLKRDGVRLPVVVITGHGDVPMAVAAMREGVIDFLEKPFDDEAFLASIRMALDSRAADTEREAARRRFDAMVATLSGRERDVLRGVVAGKLNKQIAFELGISPRTVEVYRAHLMNKTGAQGLSDLIRVAIQAGFEVD